MTAEITPPPKPVSIDELISDIRHCRSRVVQLECELAKAQHAEERAKEVFVEALRVLDTELGAFGRLKDDRQAPQR
ncbi:MAG: hypothetical protein AB1781_11080 [Pseudomonadota bacterium]